MNPLEKYLTAISQFVRREISASEFEAFYLEAFKNEQVSLPEDQFQVLDDLFHDVDAYCADEELRDEDDLDDEMLRESAVAALEKLKS